MLLPGACATEVDAGGAWTTGVAVRERAAVDEHLRTTSRSARSAGLNGSNG